MSRFRQTLGQALRGTLPANKQLTEWPSATVPQLLRLIWTAYDRLAANKLSRIDLKTSDLQLERSAAELLHDEIQLLLREEGGYASYLVAQERFEYETLDSQSNRPPQYDIAFVWCDDRTILWPCEAKVLRREGDISAYLGDVNEAFLPCIYAPFSGSGAMLGFLVTGNPYQTLTHIGKKLETTFISSPEHAQRPHRISTHRRRIPAGKSYPRDFTLHHIIFSLEVS
jgi:hypothetical protein